MLEKAAMTSPAVVLAQTPFVEETAVVSEVILNPDIQRELLWEGETDLHQEWRSPNRELISLKPVASTPYDLHLHLLTMVRQNQLHSSNSHDLTIAF